MATLRTGQTELARIERSRQLADALQAMAIQPAQIQHPFQGYAKLAQALMGVKANRAADKRERLEEGKQNRAIVEALRGPGEQVPGLVTEKESIFNRVPTGEPPFSPQQTSLIRSLPLQTQQGVIAEKLLQAPPKPQDRYDRVGPREIKIGNKWLPAEVVMTKGPEQQLGVTDGEGGFIPLGSDQIRDPVKRTSDVTPMPKLQSAEFADFRQLARTAIVAQDQIKRLRDNIVSGGMTADTFVGGVRDTLDRLASSYRALGMTVDRSQDTVRLDPASYKKFVVTDEDRKRYSQAQIDDTASFFKRFSALDAENQQIAISLAYTLARIADPGGRLSEMDVLNQMKALGLDNPSVERRLAALQSVEREFFINVQTETRFLQQQAIHNNQVLPDLAAVAPEFVERMNAVLSGAPDPAVTPKSIQLPSGASYELDVKTVNEIINMTPQQRRDMELATHLPYNSLEQLIR